MNANKKLNVRFWRFSFCFIVLNCLNGSILAEPDITYRNSYFTYVLDARQTCNDDFVSSPYSNPNLVSGCGGIYPGDGYSWLIYTLDQYPGSYFKENTCSYNFSTCEIFQYWILNFCPAGSYPDPSTGKCICIDSSEVDENGSCPYIGKNDGSPPDNSCAGNPVNIGFGNKFQTELDYKGNGNFPLTVVRTFNSMSPKWQFFPSLNPSYDLLDVELTLADGKRLTFDSDGNGGWVGEPDVTGTLESVEESEGNITDWYYTTLDQTVMHFDTYNRLASVTDKSGQFHSYVYTTYKIFVTHSNNQVLEYSRTADGRRITGFTSPDNKYYTYSYDGNGNLTGITYPNGGGTRVYHYEDSNFPSALTGITDANGNRFASWTYDTEGRAISSTHHNGPTDVDTHTIDYTYLDDATDPRATVTNPLGKQTTYHFTTLFGVRKVTQVEGHPSTNCTAANKDYSYDANGFLASKTDWQGHTTTYTRNAKGQELTRVEAAGSPEEKTITTEWHATFNLPTKITEPGRETTISYDASGNEVSRTLVEIP